VIRGEFGELISETSPYPGSIGDSVHNSARELHLRALLGEQISDNQRAMLIRFRTEIGYIRHWTAPVDWMESDMTSDGLTPLLLAYDACGMFSIASEMRTRIASAGYRSGNGQLITPALYALVKESKWLLNLAVIGQIAIFAMPLRWDDGQKKITWSGSSSCDWLNFCHCLLVASPWVSKLVSREKIITKIESYYSTEPNSDWLVDLYKRAIREKL